MSVIIAAGDLRHCQAEELLIRLYQTNLIMKKQIGIWIDLRHAWLIDASAGIVKKIKSDIEESAATGGSRSRVPYGPQGGDMSRSAQERRHHEEDHYFEAVISAIPGDTAEFVVFGPSEAKYGVQNAVEEIKHFGPRLLGVETADKMTEPQMEAWVREYFKRQAK
ncbi:MAG: hypothetical protein RJA20_1114 [Bacteroidota bacterium]